MMRVALIFISFLLLLGFFGPEHTKYMEEREDYGDFKVVAIGGVSAYSPEGIQGGLEL